MSFSKSFNDCFSSSGYYTYIVNGFSMTIEITVRRLV